MILILYRGDYWERQFLNYLHEKSIPHLSLTYKEIINSTKIFEKLSRDHSITNWYINSNKVNLKNISFTFYFYFPMEDIADLFSNYDENDKNYSIEEWFAYFRYFLSHRKVVNRFQLSEPTYSILSLPAFLSICERMGLPHLKYFYSTSQIEIDLWLRKRNDVCAKKNVYDYYDYKQDKSFSYLYIEYKESVPLLVLYVNGEIFSTIYYSDSVEAFLLPSHVVAQVYKLVNHYQVNFCEIVIRRTLNDEYLFYYFSKNPRWHLFRTNPSMIWDKIISLFPIKNENEPRNNKKKSFIHSDLRPNLKGQFIK